jgi:hypothetical protein
MALLRQFLYVQDLPLLNLLLWYPVHGLLAAKGHLPLLVPLKFLKEVVDCLVGSA